MRYRWPFVALAAAGALLALALWWGAAILHVVGWGYPAVLWEIPGAYRGWVVMRWNDPTCPALPLREGQLVVAIPVSGQACTSSASVYRHFRRHRYAYVYPNGSRGAIPTSGSPGDVAIRARSDGRTVTQGVTVDRALFFVGTREELLQDPRPTVRP
jgi:hypothetical protein